MTILDTGAAGFIGSNFVLDWFDYKKEDVVSLDLLTYAGNLENLKNPLDFASSHGISFERLAFFFHCSEIIKNLIPSVLKLDEVLRIKFSAPPNGVNFLLMIAIFIMTMSYVKF